MSFSRPLILLALAAILPLIVLSAALGFSGLREQQHEMQSVAEARVELNSVQVERELVRNIAVLTAVAQSPLFDGPVDPAMLTPYLDRLARGEPQWRGVFVSDPQGRRIASASSRLAYPDRVVDVESHAAVLRTHRPAIGRVLRRPNGVLGFAVRVPVIRDGKVVYLVSAVVDPEGLRRLLAQDPLPEGWRAGLIDASGRVAVRINAPQEAVGGFATPDTLRYREQASSGFVESTSLEGQPMISAYKVLPGFGWSIHAAIPLALYQAPVARSLWLVGVAAVAALLLFGLFLWLLMREAALRQRQLEAQEEGRRMGALGRMTGGVAHDFNNLLMIVQGSAEMLKRRRADPERVGVFADAILSAAQRGQALTRQLLAFARRSAHEPVDFHLQDRAATLGELIRRSVGEKVAVALDVPADLWPLHADPDALEIALINLAVNARDAMPDGGALAIAAANVACRGAAHGRDRTPAGLEGEFVAITVKDTGGGIPEEHLAHIFEPFYTTKPAGRGTGLGLSQVYGFAKQSGGTVTVASRAGEGASFTLYLPRAAAEPVAPSAPSASTHGAGEPGRLLLIEDDAEVARAIEAMLVSGGYGVTWVETGEAAAALLARGASFDVVLSDSLIDRSGRTVLATLRRERPELPTLLMTGRTDGGGEAAGEPTLLKPFGRDEALAALARVRAAAARSAA